MTEASDVFAGIDIGSASVRVGLYDPMGHRLSFAVRPILQFRPKSLFVEQSSADIWSALSSALREAVQRSGRAACDIAAIGVDATCSLVAVGADGLGVSVAEDGDPARDIIMWMDHRAGAETAEINATRDPALAYVGGEVSIEMEVPKVLWMKRHRPKAHEAVMRYFDLADYIVWRMTGADVASTCTLGCKWNWLAHEGRFSQSLLAAVGLSDLTEKVPAQVRAIGKVAGHLAGGVAADLGLRPGIAVATGIIDAHAGGLALAAGQPKGTLVLISGTSTCHMLVSRDPVMVPGVWGPYYDAMVPGWWLSEGGQSATGSLLDWTLRQSPACAEAEAQAKAAGKSLHAILNSWVRDLQLREPWPAADLHVLPDHHGNRSPRANPHARGTVMGLTMEDGPDALARLYLATIEALAYGTRHIIETMNRAGHQIERLVMCGGGTKNPLLMQVHADAIGLDIHLAEDEDAVTLGSGVMAAVAAGAFADIPAAAQTMVRPGGKVVARAETAAYHAAKYQIFLTMSDHAATARNAMAAFAAGKRA